MTHPHSTVAVFDSHEQAEAAVRRLAQSGYPVDHLSILGKGFHSEEEVVGFYNAGDRILSWGKNGALWGGLWGLMTTGLFMAVPLVGPVLVLGHLGAMVVGALQAAAVGGGLGAIGGALASIGVPENSVLRYEQAMRAEKFIVVAHGTAEEARRAMQLLAEGGPTSLDTYARASEAAATNSAPQDAQAARRDAT